MFFLRILFFPMAHLSKTVGVMIFPLCVIAFEAVAIFFLLIGDHCEKGFKLVLPVPAACLCVIVEGDGSPPPQSSATEPRLLA